MNVINPGSCKASRSKIAFKQMENIGMFLQACEQYGIVKTDLFQTVDLFDNTNIGQVVQTICALGNVTPKLLLRFQLCCRFMREM